MRNLRKHAAAVVDLEASPTTKTVPMRLWFKLRPTHFTADKHVAVN